MASTSTSDREAQAELTWQDQADFWKKEAMRLRKEFNEIQGALDDAKDRIIFLELALFPFSELLKEHHKTMPDDRPIFAINGSEILVGDLRRAYNAIYKG